MHFPTTKTALMALAIAAPLISASPLPSLNTALLPRQGGANNPGGTIVGPLQDGTGNIIASTGNTIFDGLAGLYKALLNTGFIKPATGN